MPLFDLSLAELQTYLPARNEPEDFDAFWQKTLDDARSHPLRASFTPVDFGLATIEVADVTFSGYGGQPIKGWFLAPRQSAGNLPCIVQYIGYGGGRGLPYEWLVWPSAGFATLVMDTRGQGSAWRSGDTPDLQPDGASVHYPGFMTLGVLDPATYYYRRVFTDAVRAVEAACTHPWVDATRVALTGGSQGGGITLAVGGLLPEVPAIMPDVPFLCHYRRAVELVDTDPYNEITHFCSIHRGQTEQVFRTLSYFDGLNFAVRARAKALFSTGLMDDTCPPSTVFAAYNYYAGPKALKAYEFNRHEGGGPFQIQEQVQFIKGLWG